LYLIGIIYFNIIYLYVGFICRKKGPKPQFFDVACPNKNCKFYGLTGQGNITGNGTYISRGNKNKKRSLSPVWQSIQ